MTSRWLGSLPEGWRRGRLDQVASAWTSNVDKHSIEGQPPVRLCNYTDVYKNDAIVEGMNFMVATATSEQLARFRLRHGDTVITKDSETADDIGVPAYVAYEADDLVCGYHLAIVRPTERVDPRYLYWIMASRPTRSQWAVTAAGVTRVGIRTTDLTKLTIPIAPVEQQRSIADYLDRETARIDTLIAEQQRLIEMLRERRDAAWAASYEQLRISYPLIPLRRVIDSIVDGPFGSSLTAAHYVEEGVRVIRLGNIGINEFKDDDRAFISAEYAAQLQGHAVVPGDVVVAGLGDDRMPLGRAAVVPDIGPAIVKADCYRVRTRSEVDPSYLAWALSAPATRTMVALLARGATRARLNTTVVREVVVPVPNLQEQRRVVEEATRVTAKIDALMAETERFIELSRERRAALITAAVTGEVDVRAEAS